MATESTARQIQPGRLANFEDAELPPPPVLPPRRPTTKSAPSPKPAAPASPETPPQSPTPPAPKPQSRPRPAPGPSAAVQISNVHVPPSLAAAVAAARSKTGMSTGDLIAAALEATHTQLPSLLFPEESGEGLFTARRRQGRRTKAGPLTPLSYRLPVADLEVIDRLVEQSGAASRSHLVTVALTAYLTPGS